MKQYNFFKIAVLSSILLIGTTGCEDFFRKSFNQTPCTWNLPVIFAYLSPDIENFSRQSDFCRQPSADLPTIIDRQVSAKEFWQESQ
mgnify:CR=1 FL=1